MNIGYKRVSTEDQSVERQLHGMEFDKVFIDKQSGKDTDRPAYKEMMSYVREGDTLYIHSLDRLSRSLIDLIATVRDLVSRGVTVRFVKENLYFDGSQDHTSTLMMSILGAFSEFERSIMRERQKEGISLAKMAGKYKGRKRKLTEEEALELRKRAEAGENKAALAREYDLTRGSIYNYLNRTKKRKKKAAA